MNYIYPLKVGMITEQVKSLRIRISRACEKAGRNPQEVTLVAVSKTFGAASIRDAFAAGVTDFGENYVAEYKRKRAELSDLPLRWHFIGHLQTNKAKDVATGTTLLQSLDSVRLAEALSNRLKTSGIRLNALVEVNTTGESSKFGVEPRKLSHLLSEVTAMSELRIVGLMTIGRFLPDPEESRAAFAALRQLRDENRSDALPLPHLSMGMSNDFEVAIEEGATIIRVGTAIFGKRTAQP